MTKRTIIFPSDRFGYIWNDVNDYVYLTIDDVKIKKILLRDLMHQWEDSKINTSSSMVDSGYLPNMVRWLDIDSNKYIVERAPTNFLPWTLWAIVLDNDNTPVHAELYATEHTLSYPGQALFRVPSIQQIDLEEIDLEGITPIDLEGITLDGTEPLSRGEALDHYLSLMISKVETMIGVDHGSPRKSMEQPLEAIEDFTFESLRIKLKAYERDQEEKEEFTYFDALCDLIEKNGSPV